MKYLVVGLGNIGPEYDLTRHNIGFSVLDHLAHNFNVEFSANRLASTTQIKYKGRPITLAKPSVYMNNSGKSTLYWLNNLKIKESNYIIVTDDIALPFGKIRIKPKGGSGGHNGLKDIEQHLGTTKYPRMRFGIGNNFSQGQQSSFVLGKFSSEEQKQIPQHIKKASEALLCFCTLGINQAMNQYNI